MAQTRYNNEPCRISKKLQQMTDQGRYILNTPGNGENPYYIEDPQIILQKWGGNFQTNTTNVESDLFRVNRQMNRDYLGKSEYQNYTPNSEQINYPTYGKTFTEESRALMPAWTVFDKEQTRWDYLPFNPQANIEIPFHCNLNTRNLERDNFLKKGPINYFNNENIHL
jgi:hypothetical protein